MRKWLSGRTVAKPYVTRTLGMVPDRNCQYSGGWHVRNYQKTGRNYHPGGGSMGVSGTCFFGFSGNSLFFDQILEFDQILGWGMSSGRMSNSGVSPRNPTPDEYSGNSRPHVTLHHEEFSVAPRENSEFSGSTS